MGQLAIAVFTSLFALQVVAADMPVAVQPHDGTADGSFLQPYTTEWTMTAIDSDGNRHPAGRWTDQLEITHSGAQRKRTQHTFGVTGEWQSGQVHVFTANSLVPVRSHYTSRRGASHSEIREHGTDQAMVVEGVMLPHPEQPPLHYSGSLERPAFDFNLAGLLLVSFPLQTGYSATFPYLEPRPTFEPGSRELRSVDLTIQQGVFEVVGVEALRIGEQDYPETFVVTTSQGNHQLKFWLSKKSPYVLRLERTVHADTMLWEIQQTEDGSQ